MINKIENVAEQAAGNKELNYDELCLLNKELSKIGVEVKQYWAVIYPDDKVPAAIFENKAWADSWQKGIITCEVIPYLMQIKR